MASGMSRMLFPLPAEFAHKYAGEKLDPRAAIAGRSSGTATAAASGEPWTSGLFDRGSWIECQAGWARSVITGRARLGGVPVGVIAVETQTVMLNIPADPGAPDSSERIIPQVRSRSPKVYGGAQSCNESHLSHPRLSSLCRAAALPTKHGLFEQCEGAGAEDEAGTLLCAACYCSGCA